MSFLFNKFAFLYDGFMHHTGLANEKRILQYFGNVKGMKIADIGGGTGSLSLLLAGLEAEATIIDSSAAMTAIAKKKDQRIKIINANAENIPVADNLFDRVCMKDCLHHIVNQEKALREAMRVLKPNGKIIIMEFNPKSIKSKLIYFFERILGEKTKLVDPEALDKMLYQNLSQGHVFLLNAFEYVYVGVKYGESSTLV
ncbi:MAG: methyltransferase domain-containing protein [Clostridia bacterium]|nr:methyltransferase domain-containing protein [Clostridia bacterium]